MDKFDWHGMADEFGKALYAIVRNEEKTHGFCKICRNELMRMVGVKNGMHKIMFRWGAQKYLCPIGFSQDSGNDDWSPTESDGFTLISHEKWNVIRAKENLKFFLDEYGNSLYRSIE